MSLFNPNKQASDELSPEEESSYPDEDEMLNDEELDEVDTASLETRDMIEEVLRLTRQNHRILRQQHRARKLESLRGILRLLVFLAILIIGFILAKPYIDGAKRIYQSVADKVETVSNAAQSIQNTSAQLQQGQEQVSGFFTNLKASFDSGLKDDTADLGGIFGGNN